MSEQDDIKRIGPALVPTATPNLFEEFERLYVRPKSGTALVIGSKNYPTKHSDRRDKHPEVIGIDMLEGDGVDQVMDLTQALPANFGPFSHIDCISVLEHCKKPAAMAKNILRLLRPGGTLLISTPFMWRVHGYPEDYWRFTKDGIAALFPGIEWQRLCYAHTSLSDEFRVPQVIFDGHIYFARTEVFGFGEKA